VFGEKIRRPSKRKRFSKRAHYEPENRGYKKNKETKQATMGVFRVRGKKLPGKGAFTEAIKKLTGQVEKKRTKPNQLIRGDLQKLIRVV